MIVAISSEAIPSARVKPVARMDRAGDRRRGEREHQGPLRIGPMAGLPVNGVRIEVAHMYFFRYDAEGRLTDLWHVWNTIALACQLGAPAPDLRVGAPAKRSRRAATLAAGNDRSRLDSTAVERDRCHRAAWRRPAAGELRSANERLRGEAQVEALDEVRDATGVHLKPVALAKVAEGGRVRLCDAAELDELREEALEAGGRDDLQNPARAFPGVPERVPLAAGLEDEVAGAGLEHVIAEERSHAAFEHVAVLVFAEVAVERRCECVRRHRVLDEREAPAGRIAVDHEADSNAAEESGLAVCGPQD